MKIDNRTVYDTLALRTLICAAHDNLAKDEGRLPQWGAVTVVVRYQRSNGRKLGFAYYHGTRMELLVPRPSWAEHHRRLDYWAAVIEHEIQHLRGYRHANMGRGSACQRAVEIRRCAYALELGLGTHLVVKAPKPVVQRDVQAERYGRVLAAEKRWGTKLKRAQTALRRLRSQRRYYEKQMAARGTDGA